MTFVAQNDLERALMRAPSDPSARPEFYRLLLGSDLLVVGKVAGRVATADPHVAAAGDKLQIASTERDGKAYIPLFSSLPRLQTYVREVTDYVGLNGRTLFEMTRGASLVLNPGSDYGKELLPEEIQGLLDPGTPSPITIDKPTQVLIGQPAVYPHDLVNALKTAFAARSDVIAAYLVQIAFADAAQPPHPLIGVETTGPWEPVSSQIGRIASMVAPGMLLDVAPIDRTDPQATLTDALLKTTPFYLRKTS